LIAKVRDLIELNYNLTDKKLDVNYSKGPGTDTNSPDTTATTNITYININAPENSIIIKNSVNGDAPAGLMTIYEDGVFCYREDGSKKFTRGFVQINTDKNQVWYWLKGPHECEYCNRGFIRSFDNQICNGDVNSSYKLFVVSYSIAPTIIAPTTEWIAVNILKENFMAVVQNTANSNQRSQHFLYGKIFGKYSVNGYYFGQLDHGIFQIKTNNVNKYNYTNKGYIAASWFTKYKNNSKKNNG